MGTNFLDDVNGRRMLWMGLKDQLIEPGKDVLLFPKYGNTFTPNYILEALDPLVPE